MFKITFHRSGMHHTVISVIPLDPPGTGIGGRLATSGATLDDD